MVVAHVDPKDRWSYVHDGKRGLLDHALVTDSLAAQVADVGISHDIRASDHAPVLVDLEVAD